MTVYFGCALYRSKCNCALQSLNHLLTYIYGVMTDTGSDKDLECTWLKGSEGVGLSLTGLKGSSRGAGLGLRRFLDRSFNQKENNRMAITATRTPIVTPAIAPELRPPESPCGGALSAPGPEGAEGNVGCSGSSFVVLVEVELVLVVLGKASALSASVPMS